MSKEQLLDKHNGDEILTTQNICNIKYNVFFLVLIACSYSVLFITMAINLNSMTDNLDLIIQFMNSIQQKQINATTIESIHDNLNLMKDCILHKYCKRVPD
jgi:hypothetical protein